MQLALPDGQAEEREVKVGIDDGTKIEILEGLQENDTVFLEKGMVQSRWQNASSMKGGRRVVRASVQAGGRK